LADFDAKGIDRLDDGSGTDWTSTTTPVVLAAQAGDGTAS
jgi:hypothetical protein